jgi:ribonuclease HI
MNTLRKNEYSRKPANSSDLTNNFDRLHPNRPRRYLHWVKLDAQVGQVACHWVA